MTGVGIGLIGAGTVGEIRARAMRRHPAASLIAIADLDVTRAAGAARAVQAAAHADYRALLDDAQVSAVIVASPVQLHEEMVVAALQAGKHVLCEKPLSNSVESCRRMLDAAAAAGRVLTVGFNHRYYPCFRDLKRLVEEGVLGPVDHVRAFGGHEGMSQFRAPWMYERATLGGGATMDVGIHVSDLVAHLGFPPLDVTAVTTNAVWGVPGSEDNALVIGRTAAGIPVAYQATWSEWKGYRIRVEVYGRDGMGLAHYPPLLNLIVRGGANGRRRREWRLHPVTNLRERLLGWTVTAEEACRAEIADFVRVIEGGSAACATGVDGLRAVAFSAAAVASSETGRTVRVDI